MKWKEWFHRRFTIIGIPPFTYHIIIIEQEHFRYFCQLNIPIYRTFSHNTFNTKSIHSTPYHFYDKSVLSVLSSENFGIWNPSQDKSWDSLRCLYFLESTLGLLTSKPLSQYAYHCPNSSSYLPQWLGAWIWWTWATDRWAAVPHKSGLRKAAIP